MAPFGLMASRNAVSPVRSTGLFAATKIASAAGLGCSKETFSVRSRKTARNSGSSTPRMLTFIPGFTPSLSSSDLGCWIFCAHLSAFAPSWNTAGPSENSIRSSPSRASSDRISLNGIFNRTPSPRNTSSSVSRRALPSETLFPKRRVQRASWPIRTARRCC